MLLKSSDLTFASMMAAIAVIIVTVAGYVDVSTIFFMALAAFLGGIVERRTSVKYGIMFAFASGILSFILAPQKMYILTFIVFSVYILSEEYFERANVDSKRIIPIVIKAVTYNIMVILACVLCYLIYGFDFLKNTKFYGVISEHFLIAIIAFLILNQVFLFIFDRAYYFFMRRYSYIFTGHEQ